MLERTPGCVQVFGKRTGGYINYLFLSEKLRDGEVLEDHMHTEAEANQMLAEANTFIEKYFPWMKDFVIFQLSDGTVRLDAADRAFLDGE